MAFFHAQGLFEGDFGYSAYVYSFLPRGFHKVWRQGDGYALSKPPCTCMHLHSTSTAGYGVEG
jgi:hypothetical protein